jgi:NAD(P)-dependent dehydrogenase (short-subunit alcohol dehydrogenase family)
MRGESNVGRVQDKVVLITGTARGPGRGHAVRLEAETMRRHAVVADVDVPGRVAALAAVLATAAGHFDGALDVVVANAEFFPLRTPKSLNAFADAFDGDTIERKLLR